MAANRDLKYRLVFISISGIILLLHGGIAHTLQKAELSHSSHTFDNILSRHRRSLGPRLGPCPAGHFNKRFANRTRLCLPCTQCSYGEEVIRECTRHHDRRCGNCILGQFYYNRLIPSASCQPCRVCSNQVTLQECRAEQDRICGGCDIGYFYDEVLSRCTTCSYCWPEVPGFATKIPECTRQNINQDYTCLPSASTPPQSKSIPPTASGDDALSTDTRFLQLEAKLMGIQRYLKQEIIEARNDLHFLREHVKGTPE